ncbi:hypothetical protein ACIPSE_24595 [Streptomyces sp. NPDC090106]|uniref:hypothetical protein n=1 Tax=Streptomyces sp. NPDC090106 TaxID=3365946 RepID=UPI0038266FCD
MDEPRKCPSGSRASTGATRRPPTRGSAGGPPRGFAPPPALCGFLLLLALMFTVSYGVGAAAGPVAPGLHGTAPSDGDVHEDGTGGGTDGTDPGGMDMGGGAHEGDR